MPEKKYKECKYCGHETRPLTWNKKREEYVHYSECRVCNDFGNRHGFKLKKSDRKLLNSKPYCQICGTKEDLHVDHDHSTNKVRGYLCRNHNVALGLFEDNPLHLELAIKYLSTTEET